MPYVCATIVAACACASLPAPLVWRMDPTGMCTCALFGLAGGAVGKALTQRLQALAATVLRAVVASAVRSRVPFLLTQFVYTVLYCKVLLQARLIL